MAHKPRKSLTMVLPHTQVLLFSKASKRGCDTAARQDAAGRTLKRERRGRIIFALFKVESGDLRFRRNIPSPENKQRRPHAQVQGIRYPEGRQARHSEKSLPRTGRTRS